MLYRRQLVPSEEPERRFITIDSEQLDATLKACAVLEKDIKSGNSMDRCAGRRYGNSNRSLHCQGMASYLSALIHHEVKVT